MKPYVLALVVVAVARPALAQMCPDGSPPPCRAARPALPPPLDSTRWLVLPFENRTAHPDSALLREGTATMLRLELERWPELKIVDEAAVTDQLRRLHLEGRPVSLAQARAIARAFGAGNIVLGQIVPGTHSVRVLARSYSTRTGRRAREGTVVTQLTDSAFTGAMGSVAAGLLNLALVPGTQGPAVGTQSLPAYREYVLGRLAMLRYPGTGATEHFRRAIALDSTFAMAYYGTFLALSDIDGSAGPQARPMVMAAQRYSMALPLRERRKIAAAEALSRGARAEACRLNIELLAADTVDVDVMWGLSGSCCCDAQVVPDTRSPSGYAFATSLQTSVWAARRILERDSTNESPYQAIFMRLGLGLKRTGCLVEASDVCPLDKQMSAWVLLDHDTLYTVPWPVGGFRDGRPVGDTTSAATVWRATQAKLEMVRPVLERWRANFPDSRVLRVQYATFFEELGQPELALPIVRDFTSRRRDWAYGQLAKALAVLWQVGRPQEAAALYDSLQQAATVALARGDSSLLGLRVAVWTLGVAVGRDPLKWATAEDAYGYLPYTDMIRRWLGLGPDSLLPFEADSGRGGFRFRPEALGPDGRPNALGNSRLAMARLYYSVVGFHDRRTLLVADTVDRPPWEIVAGLPLHPIQVFQVRLTSGDTAGARELLRRADYQLMLGAPHHPFMGLRHVFVAESYLELGDSAAALERLRDYARRFPRSSIGYTHVPDVPRIWIRYGDLAYALHQRDDAIRAYRFITELWADADPLFQPTVQRARTRLAELTRIGN
jgi:tetratricopeptide (TPR) repeat protein/TolB-like protein